MSKENDFRIKLFQFWVIPLKGSGDWRGIWQTIAVNNIGCENESWQLRCTMIGAMDQPLGETRWLPKWLMLESCTCVKLPIVHTKSRAVHKAYHGYIDYQKIALHLREKNKVYHEALEDIGQFEGEGGPCTPWREIVRDLGERAREALKYKTKNES